MADTSLDEVLRLLRLVFKKFYSSTTANAKLLRSVLTLMFYTILKYKEVYLGQPDSCQAEKKIDKIWMDLHKLVAEDWIILYYTETFGDPSYSGFKTATEDIKVHAIIMLSLYLSIRHNMIL